MSRERLLPVNGVELCVETFGAATDPAVLLIAGGASSMDWWEDRFCERLAAGKRFVIRYDFRDTGRSISYPAGEPSYGMDDLVTDACSLLDVLEVDSAHLVGMSMGGEIAMRLAVDHPAHVDSLTLMSTSPGGPGGPKNPDLPKMTKQLAAYFANESLPDWSDRAAVIEYILAALRAFAGRLGVDEPAACELLARVFDRTTNMASAAMNHSAMRGGAPIRPRLGAVAAPTLVLHGTDDPLFPIAHAQALAREIRGARLLALEGVGHEMPPPATWDLVIPALLAHTAPGAR
jgi:pimeloyl-ACP methyl ester carboxylesterase